MPAVSTRRVGTNYSCFTLQGLKRGTELLGLPHKHLPGEQHLHSRRAENPSAPESEQLMARVQVRISSGEQHWKDLVLIPTFSGKNPTLSSMLGVTPLVVSFLSAH